MKVLLLGDSHGAAGHIDFALDKAKRSGCAKIVSLGDFGYWPHVVDGQDFLSYVNRRAVEENIPVYFIDGNHENFDCLWEDAKMYDVGAYDDFRQLNSHLYYVPRTMKWQWGKVKFMAFGGADSIDKDWRKMQERAAGTTRQLWWPQEAITEGDLIRALEKPGDVDVLLTHDAPEGAAVPGITRGYPEGDINRRFLREVAEFVHPKIIIHGHMHRAYVDVIDYGYGKIRVEGLHCNSRAQYSYKVLDLL